MDFSSFIALIPKLAASLLVILFFLIIFEVKNLLRSKNKGNVQKLTLSNQPEVVTTVRFPQTGVQTEVLPTSQTPITVGKKRSRLLFLIIPLLVVALFIGVNIIATRQSTPEPVVEPTATPVPQEISTRIVIYQVDSQGQWIVLTQDELKKLAPGSEIKIAVSSGKPITEAEFTVNSQAFSSSSDKTPYGDLYIDYQIQEGVTDYHIAVIVQ